MAAQAEVNAGRADTVAPILIEIIEAVQHADMEVGIVTAGWGSGLRTGFTGRSQICWGYHGVE